MAISPETKGEDKGPVIHPLSNYQMIMRENQPEEDTSVPARLARLEEQYAETGMRRTVEALMLVMEHEFPHILVLQVANAFYKLPGGYLDPSESDQDGLLARLNQQLGVPDGKGGYAVAQGKDWTIGKCMSTWWRPEFNTFFYPYLPRHQTAPKEIRKIVLVHLPPHKTFAVPANMKLVAVPLFELYDNAARYGPVMASLPVLISQFFLGQQEGVLEGADVFSGA